MARASKRNDVVWVSREGRCIAIRDRGRVGTDEHIVVENFFDELRAKIPR